MQFDVRQALACRSFGDKLKEVRLKIAFAPLPLGGAGEGGRSYGKREKQISCVRGLSARAGSFLGIDS
jgi:hypothetical protein